MFHLSNRSIGNLKGVRPELIKVVTEAIKITPIDFAVTEGLRTIEKQKRLVEIGASQTMNSRHITGHAVDVAAWVDGEVRWDSGLYYQIADAMFEAASPYDVKIEWGGDWKRFKDYCHFQLSWKDYPA